MTVRVLQLMLTPAIGGAETLARGLTAGLAEHGFDVQDAYLDPTGAVSSPIARLQRLFLLVRQTRPDVVLAHSALPNLYARVVCRRIPVITVLHSASRDFDNPVLRRAERLLARRTAVVVAVARPQAEEYRAAFGERTPLVLIPNGVSADLPVKEPGSGVVIRVVTLARINTQKDPATWRQAASIVTSARPELSFAWFGPESDDPELQALVAGADSPAVTWAGSTSDSGGVLAGADIYFHAARAEAHPLAPLEAAAVGLPVVCSEAVASTLPAGLPAATFSAGDGESAAAAVLRVADDLAGSARRAAVWRLTVRADYGMDRVIGDYANVLGGSVPGRVSSARVITPIG